MGESFIAPAWPCGTDDRLTSRLKTKSGPGKVAAGKAARDGMLVARFRGIMK